MKYEFYKAVDAIDGMLSIFVFDEYRNYTVVPYSDWHLKNLFHRAIENSACNWSFNSNRRRFQDMTDPKLMFVIESGE